MVDLLNLNTNQIEDISIDRAESALMNGTHSFAGQSPISLKGTESNELWEFEPSKAKDAIASGKFRFESPKEIEVRKYVDDNSGIIGGLKVGLGQAADELLLGIPELIYDKTADPFNVEKKNALKESWSTLNSIAGVTGAVGGLVYGAPIYKGAATVGETAGRAVTKALVGEATESVARKAAAKVIGGAAALGTESALLSTPRAITELSLGDPQAAAETLMLGGGFGLLLGGASSVVGTAASLTKSVLPSVDDLIDNQASKALGFSQKFYNPKKLRAEKIKETTDYFIENNLIKSLEKSQDTLARVEKLKDKAWQSMSKVYSTLDDAGIKVFNPKQVFEAVESKIGNKYKNEPLYKSLSNQYDNSIQTIINRGDQPVTFLEAQDLKNTFSQFIYKDGVERGEKLIARRILGVINSEIDNALDVGVKQLTSTKANKALIAEYKAAKEAYGHYSNAVRGLVDKVAKQEGNNLIGLGDYFAGSVGAMAGSVALGAIGLPVGAVGTFVLNEMRDRYGAQVAVNTLTGLRSRMDKIGAGISFLPQVIDGKYKPSKAYTGNVIARFLQDDPETDRTKLVEQLNSRVSDLQTNIETTTNLISQQSSTLNNIDSQLNTAYQSQLLNTLNYISNSVPKAPQTNNPLNNYKWKPTDRAISSFERKLKVIENPFSIYDDIAKGTLTTDHVDALRSNYPMLYQSIVQQLIKYTSGSEKKIPLKVRQNLSLLTGASIENSPGIERFGILQSNSNQESEQEAAPAPARVKLSMAEDSKTEVTKIANR